MKKESTATPTFKESKFTKQQFLEGSMLVHLKDVLSAVLQDGKTYTLKEAEKLVSEYFERKV